jgi:hypothetical protein
MQLVTRVLGLLTVVIFTLTSAWIGLHWSWIALPRTVDTSLDAAWNLMGGVNPLLLVIAAFLALGSLALLVFALVKVGRDSTTGWVFFWGAVAWGCLSALGAAVAFTVPGLFVIDYVERVVPGFTDGIVPDHLQVVNGLRLGLAPTVIGLGVVSLLARSVAIRRVGGSVPQ